MLLALKILNIRTRLHNYYPSVILLVLLNIQRVGLVGTTTQERAMSGAISKSRHAWPYASLPYIPIKLSTDLLEFVAEVAVTVYAPRLNISQVQLERADAERLIKPGSHFICICSQDGNKGWEGK